MNPSATKRQARAFRQFALVMTWTACLSASGGAAGMQVECPGTIERDSVQLRATPPGWTAYVGAPLYLHNAAPMSGPPDQLGELVESRQTQVKGGIRYTYELDGKFIEGKWLACRYGESDQVTLARRLDDGIRSCAITHRNGKFVGQKDIAIACK